MEMENIGGDQGETADKDEGCNEETNFDDDLTDHNWLIGGDLDDDSVRFNWSHHGYGTGNGHTVHVNTDYEAAIRRRRNLLSRDVKACFDKILDLETDCREPGFVDWLFDMCGFKIKRGFSE